MKTEPGVKADYMYITKFHQIYNLVGQRFYRAKKSSLEIKCRTARIEVDYSS